MRTTPLLGIYSNPYIDAYHLTGPDHDECPGRTAVIDLALKKAGLLNSDNRLRPNMATDADILRCHGSDYLEKLKEETNDIVELNEPDDGTVTLTTGDTNICSKSMRVAYFTAGAALISVDGLMKGIYNRVFCNIRPPGHHACSQIGMGFCILNNAAIAARYAQSIHNIERVAIIDWDVHHGNGTQEIFYNDPSVHYCSTHRFGSDKDKFYPGTGDKSETGRGKGKGFTLNCPITLDETPPRIKILKAFKDKLIPAMEKFKPQLVIISAGFDAGIGDPVGEFDLTDKDFVELTHIVREIADKYAEGRILSLLEGGYNLECLPSAVVAHVTALIEPTESPEDSISFSI